MAPRPEELKGPCIMPRSSFLSTLSSSASVYSSLPWANALGDFKSRGFCFCFMARILLARASTTVAISFTMHRYGHLPHGARGGFRLD